MGQAFAHHGEQVGGVGLRDEAAPVQQDRVVGAGHVGFDLGQDRVEQVGVVDARVEHVRSGPAHARGDQPQPAGAVHRRLVLGQHDQRAAGGVQPRVHAAGDLHPAGQREAHVHPVAHAVGVQRGAAVADFNEALQINGKDTWAYNNRGIVWFEKGEFDKAIADYDQALRLEPKHTWAYHNRGNALDHRVERRQARLVAVAQDAVDPVHDVGVALVVALQHGVSMRRARGCGPPGYP